MIVLWHPLMLLTTPSILKSVCVDFEYCLVFFCGPYLSPAHLLCPEILSTDRQLAGLWSTWPLAYMGSVVTTHSRIWWTMSGPTSLRLPLTWYRPSVMQWKDFVSLWDQWESSSTPCRLILHAVLRTATHLLPSPIALRLDIALHDFHYWLGLVV